MSTRPHRAAKRARVGSPVDTISTDEESEGGSEYGGRPVARRSRRTRAASSNRVSAQVEEACALVDRVIPPSGPVPRLAPDGDAESAGEDGSADSHDTLMPDPQANSLSRAIAQPIQVSVDTSKGNLTTINIDLASVFNSPQATEFLQDCRRISGAIRNPFGISRQLVAAESSPTTYIPDMAITISDTGGLLPSTYVKMLQHKHAVAQDAPAVFQPGLVSGTQRSFLDLDLLTRRRVYRLVFVERKHIDFQTRTRFSRSSAFLRTCKVVHDEGSQILYSENAFYFSRNCMTRGLFWEQEWAEIGYTDVFRFLKTVGANIGLLRYIAIELGDNPNTRGYNDTEADREERRFTNDKVLYAVLKLLGANAHLKMFSYRISSRRSLKFSEQLFLNALCAVKSEKVENFPTYYNGSAISEQLETYISRHIRLVRDHPDHVDEIDRICPREGFDLDRRGAPIQFE